MDCPPYIGNVLIFVLNLQSLFNSSDTCIASSLVGQSINTCTPCSLGSIFSIAGIPKAQVLPVPVCAWPIISLPAITSGIPFDCIGVDSSKPISFNALSMGSERFISLNFKFSIHFLSFFGLITFPFSYRLNRLNNNYPAYYRLLTINIFCLTFDYITIYANKQ